jgi:hypothetical protein
VNAPFGDAPKHADEPARLVGYRPRVDRQVRLAKIKQIQEMHTEQHVVVVRLGALLLHSGSRALTDHSSQYYSNGLCC